MLEVKNIHMSYEGIPLLLGISFSLSRGKTISLLGPSGGGKTTLLRIIAGLEQAESGEICWNGEEISSLPVHQRQFGLMFQDYALFPHKTVYENIAFGMRMKGDSKADIEKRIGHLIAQTGLMGFENRSVIDLSGGERQRVALARTLAPSPRLIMLDEPLAALDRSLSEFLAAELRSMLKQTEIPAIYVTHDQKEAFTIADEIYLLRDGKIIQHGNPYSVHHFPISVWAAHFMGHKNFLPAEVVSVDPLICKTDIGNFYAYHPKSNKLKIGDKTTLMIRSRLSKRESSRSSRFEGHVQDQIFLGDYFLVQLITKSGVQMEFYLDEAVQQGSLLSLDIASTDTLLFKE